MYSNSLCSTNPKKEGGKKTTYYVAAGSRDPESSSLKCDSLEMILVFHFMSGWLSI